MANRLIMTNPVGRPSDYTQELADDLCRQFALGHSMRKVCVNEDMPAMTTIFRWLRTKEEFKQQYETAKDEAADLMVEEINDIADNSTNDYMANRVEMAEMEDKTIGELSESEISNLIGRLAPEHIQRSRLRVDARKWTASKLKPKKYGDKTTTEHSGVDGKPIEHAWSVEIVDAANPST